MSVGGESLQEDERGTRERLLGAAFEALEGGGVESLRARDLTKRIDASTMALYTHFGGMPGLIDALVRDGLKRFAEHIRAFAPQSDDPLKDLISGGVAYSAFALANPQLYRLMFGLGDAGKLRGFGSEVEAGQATWSMAEGVDAFSVLLRSVERGIEAGIFLNQDATAAATQILTATHGYVLLLIGGFIGDPEAATREVAIPLNVTLLAGLGADREQVESAIGAALSRLG